ncbi:hypothetical protein IT399_01555 [Candidatus Nomurabacteria bacterium]|nr:hypothetical protein [Candidatus Nomurabacteria bacterium]
MKKILLLSLFAVLFMFGSFVYADTIVTDLVITTPPTKTIYTAGESLNLTGLVVKISKSNAVAEYITFTDFASKGITINMKNGSILGKVGALKLIIKAGDKTATQLITVNPIPTITSITVLMSPKTVYYFGDSLDLTGLVVRLTKSNTTDGKGAPIIEEVAFANFAAKGITTSIKDKTILKSSDKKVTIKVAKVKVDLPITVNVNSGCVDIALGIRETTVANALNTFTSTMTTAFSARKNALAGAWWGRPELRDAAIKAAWNTFKTTQKTARDARLNTVKSAWATWQIEAKKCGVTSFSGDTQSFDIQ